MLRIYEVLVRFPFASFRVSMISALSICKRRHTEAERNHALRSFPDFDLPVPEDRRAFLAKELGGGRKVRTDADSMARMITMPSLRRDSSIRPLSRPMFR